MHARTSCRPSRKSRRRRTSRPAPGGIGGKNLSEDFQKLEDKVALQNARSDARLNSADTSSGKALDDKLAALNSSRRSRIASPR